MATSFEPVLITFGLNGIVSSSFFWKLAASAALTSSFLAFLTKLSASGPAREPSVTTVTSKVPSL